MDSTTCGSYYYQLDGKPLLGMMFNSYAQKQDWLNYETKTHTGDFTVKYVLEGYQIREITFLAPQEVAVVHFLTQRHLVMILVII